MSGAVKKTTFEDLQDTLSIILSRIDELLKESKGHANGKPIWHKQKSFKAYLKKIEKDALKDATELLGLGATTVRDRWKILTLPHPVYSAIESGEISFSKAKPLTSIVFDFESDSDSEVCFELVEYIKQGAKLAEIKEAVSDFSSKVWNESSIIMQRIAEQNGITEDSVF